MELAKEERLESSGWKVGTVADFLALTSEESALVEAKLCLNMNQRYAAKVARVQSNRSEVDG